MNSVAKILAALLFCLMTMGAANTDCVEASSQLCVSNIPKGFNFLKSYPVNLPNSKGYQEQSYVFTKGTVYLIRVCQTTGKPVELSLMDNGRTKVGTNSINGTTVDAISYACSATGIYYIRLLGSDTYCGNCLIAFSRL
ncbi:MAG: hypothetical protein IM613_18570 [Cytophagales bacterium]|nr:hypothetical protein [Cytophagales bacterium]